MFFVGLKLEYDLSQPFGHRLVSIKVRCQNCDVPKYNPLNNKEIYRIVLPSFIVGGGNNYTVIVNYLKNVKKGPINFNVFKTYIRHRSPVFQELEERIIIHTKQRK